MRSAVPFGYTPTMSFMPAGHFGAAFAPLLSRFGSQLTVCRDGDAVRWALGGRVTIVEADGSALRAMFVERATRDSVSETAIAPLYRAADSYQLTGDGAGRLGLDMAAFFFGIREPRFRFAGFQERPLSRY